MTLLAFDVTDDRNLVDRVRQAIHAAGPGRRGEVVEAITEALASTSRGPRIVALLAAAAEPELRQLTVRVAVRAQPTLDPALLLVLRHALVDRAIPEADLLDLAAFLLRATAADPRQALPILRTLLAKVDGNRSLERLQKLEDRTGPLPALASWRERVRDRSVVHCPRCQVSVSRPELAEHLWLEHRLVLDGQTIREPWRLIDDWVEEYHQRQQPELLDRCRALARRADPSDGEQRLKRLFLAYRVENAAVSRPLLDDARKRRGTVCPHCYAVVVPPHDVRPRPLNVSRGRITGAGFRVEVRDSGLRTSLEIDTPAGFLHNGAEPGHVLTPRGAMVYLSGPWVALGLVLAVLGSFLDWPVLPLVLILLALGAMLAAAAAMIWRNVRPPLGRAVDHAWALVVPRLLTTELAEHVEFLAGLALASVGHGTVADRAGPLLDLTEAAEEAVASGSLAAAYLGAIRRLAVADAARTGSDPVAVLVLQISRALEGQLPASYLDALLSGWEENGWSDGDRARLRVLVCDRAFEVGYEVRNLLETCDVAPALGAVLRIDQPQALAALRLLWSFRTSMPWARAGNAATAFELAIHREAGAKHLGLHPDLLLAIWEVRGGYLCASGFVFNGIRFTEMPGAVEVRPLTAAQGGGFTLLLGSHEFWFADDPDPVLLPLDFWFRYYFQEFRPLIADAYGWRSASGVPAGGGVRTMMQCPTCGTRLIARIGELALAAPP